MTNAWAESSFVALPGPDPAVADSQGPDMLGHALEFVAVGMPFGGRIYCRVYGTSVVVDAFLAEPTVVPLTVGYVESVTGLSDVEELFKLGP